MNTKTKTVFRTDGTGSFKSTRVERRDAATAQAIDAAWARRILHIDELAAKNPERGTAIKIAAGVIREDGTPFFRRDAEMPRIGPDPKKPDPTAPEKAAPMPVDIENLDLEALDPEVRTEIEGLLEDRERRKGERILAQLRAEAAREKAEIEKMNQAAEKAESGELENEEPEPKKDSRDVFAARARAEGSGAGERYDSHRVARVERVDYASSHERMVARLRNFNEPTDRFDAETISVGDQQAQKDRLVTRMAARIAGR